MPCNRVARWTGTTFAPLGTGLDGPVYALATLPDGSLVAGGAFQMAGGNNLARWDGTAWSPLGSGTNNTVEALAVLPNGDLVAAGQFSQAGAVLCNRIARWNGSAWTAYPNTNFTGYILTVHAMPDGGVVVGTGGVFQAGSLWRWNGSFWAGGSANNGIQALALTTGGELHIGGSFTEIAGNAHLFRARMETTCPPTVIARPNPCVAPYDTSALAARNAPWLASTFRVEASGLPSPSLGLGVVGFAPLVPALVLATVLPEAAAGCTLQVSPDLLVPMAPANGTLELQLPASPSVVGASLFVQAAALEFSIGGAVQTITTTGSLQATIGVF